MDEIDEQIDEKSTGLSQELAAGSKQSHGEYADLGEEGGLRRDFRNPSGCPNRKEKSTT